MEIKNEHIIIFIVALLLIWVVMTWNYKKESFASLKHWEAKEPKKWDLTVNKGGPNYYYENEESLHQSVPSIANYDSSAYKFPPEIVPTFDDEYMKNFYSSKDMPTIVPIAENTPEMSHTLPAGAPLKDLKQLSSMFGQISGLSNMIPTTSTSPMTEPSNVPPTLSAAKDNMDQNKKITQDHPNAPFKELVEKDKVAPKIEQKINPEEEQKSIGSMIKNFFGFQ